MVDEFQDTNRLQCELVDLLAGPDTERFFVGDEFQSIYGFRHADVQVFRERRAEAETLLPLTRNYRSRPEVLAAVNHLFGAEFGEEFQPLAASGDFPDPVFGTPVELLVTDKAAYSGTGVHWRRAEARHVARRVKELVDAGAASAGEIVLLFAAGTDAEWYEEELREAGLPTYRATGRGYFGQQQVVDLLSYLRLLHNRYDDEALVTVLASPFVGVSNDALMLVRRAARGPIFTGLERSLPPDLDPADVRLLQAFRQRYDRLADAAGRLSLERLCERIVAEHDYDLAVLAQWDGRRRYANLRKLARLARSYEELRGPDVEGFVRFVEEQEAVGAAERDAVAEEEGADAVRLLTIHAAKGLEFKVVVVADAGRDRNAPSADEILCLSDGRFGFQVADPVTGKRHGVHDYEDVKEARAAEDEAERLRLYYVAMTRAIDRLIVSGSIDHARKADEKTPIGWVLDRLDCAARARRAPATAPVELERRAPASSSGSIARRRPRRRRPPAAPEPEPVEAEAGQLALFAPGEAPPLPPLAPRARTDPGAAGAAAARRAPALVQRARPLRALLVPLLRRARRRHAARGRARHGRRAARAGRDRDRRRGPPPARARRPAGARPRRTSSRFAPGIPPSPTRSWRGSPASSRRTAGRSWRSGSPRSPVPGPSGRSRSSTTASSCTAASTSCTGTARGRSCSTTRRTRSRRGRPTRSSRPTTGCSGSSTRSPASGPGRRRSRSSTTSSSVRTPSCRARSRGPTCPSWRRSCRRRSAGSGRASSCRRRASSPAPAVRRSTSSAPGRACAAAAPAVPLRSPRRADMRVAALYDVHGNLPALEAVLAEVATLDVDEIVVGGDVVAGPFPRECLDRLVDLGAVFVRGNADRESPRAPAGLWDWVAERLDPLSLEFLRERPHALSLGGVLFCHGSPRDDDEILTRVSPDERFRVALAGVEERLVVGGHTHVQFDREIDGIRFVNAGSVGHAVRGPARRVLGVARRRPVELRHTPYAVDAAVVAIRAIGLPGGRRDLQAVARAGGPGRGVRLLRERCLVASSTRRVARSGAGATGSGRSSSGSRSSTRTRGSR